MSQPENLASPTTMGIAVDPLTLDAEMYAIAMCIEGLEPLKEKPQSLCRVIGYIGSRYVENLKEQLARLDAEIKVVNERLAKQKYDALEAEKRDAVTA